MENKNLGGASQVENPNAAEVNAQQKQENVFFNHVKKVIEQRHEKSGSIETIFNKFSDKDVTDPTPTEDLVETLGIFSFVMGIDYTGQRYLQKKILTNVYKRFEELKITPAEFEAYKKVMLVLHSWKPETVKEKFKPVYDKVNEKLTAPLAVPQHLVLELKTMKSKLDGILKNSVVPIKFSESLVEFKKERLTYERLLKVNSLINEQAEYSGSNVKRIVEVYGNSMFRNFLNEAADIFNNIKYFTLYEESIISVLESMSRFDLTYDPETITDEAEQKAKEKFETELQERNEKETREAQEVEYVRRRFSQEQLKTIMENQPDYFVMISIEDAHRGELKTIEDVIDGIEKLIDNEDYMQNLYTYIGQNKNSNKRKKGVTQLDSAVNVSELVTGLGNKATEYGERYKKLAEVNCAEIPDNCSDRIITYVNDLIKSCVLSTTQQKEYLTSQLISNGIKTWNQLQQIISVIETCNIRGEDASIYVNLREYITEHEDINQIFSNATELMKLEVKISVFVAMRDWYKFHVVSSENIKETSKTSETSKSESNK